MPTKHTDFILLRAIRKQPVERTPLWIMRQAGRYLPEYRKVRNAHDFLSICKTPALAAEVTLQPLRRFELDAAILFSDILLLPEALGVKLEFIENRGPRLWPRILNDKSLRILTPERVGERLRFMSEAVRLVLSELAGEKPLIGFCGSPFTLAAYMTEGTPTRNLKYIKTMIYKEPRLLERLLEMLTAAVIECLTLQISAGVHVVQIFDTWGGILPGHLYERFSARYMKEIVRSIQPLAVPVILFSKGGLDLIKALADSKADMLGVDWMTDMADARDVAGNAAALQGNLDPGALYGNKATVSGEVKKILDVFENDSGHVFNLGHGIMPDTPLDMVTYLIDEVYKQSEAHHSLHKS
ncbi:MAG: uroporphyrinogen decarboxylase [Candidatus Latescibacterota bacterium]